MAIKSKDELEQQKLQIDLTGPSGNAFVLLGHATSLGKQLKMSPEEIKSIRDDMMSKDYDHLISVFDKHFGDYVDLYR